MNKESNDYLLKIAFWGFFTLFMLIGGFTHLDLIKTDTYYPITAFILAVVGGYFLFKNLRKLR